MASEFLGCNNIKTVAEYFLPTGAHKYKTIRTDAGIKILP